MLVSLHYLPAGDWKAVGESSALLPADKEGWLEKKKNRCATIRLFTASAKSAQTHRH